MHSRITRALAYLAAALILASTTLAQGYESLPFILRPPGTTTEAWDFDENGDLTVGAATDIDLSSANSLTLPSVGLTQSTSRTVFIPAGEIRCAASAGCSEGEQGAKATLVFADTGADDNAYYTWGIPEDFDVGDSFVFVKIVYNMPSGTPAEGEWDLRYVAIADDDADAAPGNELTVLDTPSAADDWNVTSAFQIPTAAVASGDVALAIHLYHDISDTFGGDVEVLGLQITYTSDTNL